MEAGRWRGIPFKERVCQFCSEDVGDEFHTIMVCQKFKAERVKFLKPFYCRNPNILKCANLMNATSKNQLVQLCHFIKTIMSNLYVLSCLILSSVYTCKYM